MNKFIRKVAVKIFKILTKVVRKGLSNAQILQLLEPVNTLYSMCLLRVETEEKEDNQQCLHTK